MPDPIEVYERLLNEIEDASSIIERMKTDPVTRDLFEPPPVEIEVEGKTND